MTRKKKNTDKLNIEKESTKAQKIKLLNIKEVLHLKKRFIIPTFLIVLITVALFIVKEWLYTQWGGLTFNEIIFHINVPLKGTNNDTIMSFVKGPFVQMILISIFITYLILRVFKNSKRTIVASLLFMVITFSYVAKTAQIIDYIKNQLSASNLIEENYVDPREVAITAPEKKRNLIYLYLESMETSYYSKEQGGNNDTCMIPELYELAKNNTNFSVSDTMQGGYAPYGATWTTGAMTAHSGGLPLNFGVSFLDNNVNSYSKYEEFLPGMYNIGDFLHDQGYYQMFMCGSDAKFGGRTNLFKQHGDYEIYDVFTTIERGQRKFEDWVWWGFEDQNLFQYAKEELMRIGSEDKPFNFTFLTADTHFPKGHPCSQCDKKENDKYTYDDVMQCSSRQVKLFVDWCKDQPWYENTTIVIVGDHLTMDVDMGERMDENGYKRGVYNCIINGAIDIPEEKTKNKPFTTFDLFPTTLAAMGYKIDGNRLALGTNLYSDEKTLLEKHSLDYINSELAKVSKFYNKNILYSK